MGPGGGGGRLGRRMNGDGRKGRGGGSDLKLSETTPSSEGGRKKEKSKAQGINL